MTAPWSDQEIARLEELWGSLGDNGRPLTSLDIGRRMGRPKNSIVGKAHRLGLPSRPSPLGHGTHQYRDGGPPLRVNLSLRRTVPKPPAVTLALAQEPPPQPRLYAPVRACCWPLGEPRDRDFRFCDALTVPGRVYCEDHDRRAHGRS